VVRLSRKDSHFSRIPPKIRSCTDRHGSGNPGRIVTKNREIRGLGFCVTRALRFGDTRAMDQRPSRRPDSVRRHVTGDRSLRAGVLWIGGVDHDEDEVSSWAIIGGVILVAMLCGSPALADMATSQSLGWLPGSTYTQANNVSADGLTVVGFSHFSSGWHAIRWTQAGGIFDLGPGSATKASADGSVVVGESTANGGGVEAFRWTAAGGMVGLGQLGGGDTVAEDVSGDGSVVVGYAATAFAYQATI
jgi:probable HAF family extracellular repeat protein